ELLERTLGIRQRVAGEALAVPLVLVDLDQRLIPLHVRDRLRIARLVPHIAVTGVRVVRDRDDVAPVLYLTIALERLPQLERRRIIEIRGREIRHFVTTEDHVAVQVAPARLRGPFVSDERSEPAAIVRVPRRLLHALPRRHRALSTIL